MAEVLRSFDDPLHHATGFYHVRVVGRYAPKDHMWEGWLEFVPLQGSGRPVVVSAIESRQPERVHLEYWAQGLSPVYAEGSLDRARHPVTVRVRAAELPASGAPADRVVVTVTSPSPRPILDPFKVGARSLDILGQELRALGRGRVLQIIAAYNLTSYGSGLSQMSDEQLVRLAVSSVGSRLMRPTSR
jgi:hypothetical protein